jgi:predicted hydrocarbon binding protein
MEEEVGDAAGLILYKTGYEWGLEDMRAFDARMGAEFGGGKPLEWNLNFVLETWWWPLTSQGWGTWGFDFSQRKQGLIFVDLFDSAVAKSLERVGKPVCYLYAGLFSALFTHLSKKELSCIEIQCYGAGEDYCKFLIGLEKRVNAAKFWVEEGAKAGEILDKLAV